MPAFPQYGQGRPLTTQALDYTSTSAAVTSAFGAQTYCVRLAATSAVHYHIYDAGQGSSTAASTDPLLPNQIIDIVNVTAWQKVSAVKAAGGTVTSADGRMTVTELG